MVAVARAVYVLGAVFFALVAASLTRARTDLLSPLALAQVLVPTLLVTVLASTVLISKNHLAATGKWALAGVLVPIGAVAGFFSPMFLLGPIRDGGLFLMFVAAGSMLTVPVGIIGHLLLRFLIARRFHSATGSS